MDHYRRRAGTAGTDALQDNSSRLTRDFLAMQDQLSAVATELLRARKARVDELLEKERFADRLAKLLQVLPGAVLVLDDDGIVIECNSFAADLLGRPVVGQTWSEIVSRATGPEAGSQGELRLLDGRCLSLQRRRLEQEHGEILLLMDISETERLQALLQRQNRLSAMGEMTARLAHQIRTPLASAILYVSQLQHAGEEHSSSRSDFLTKALRRLRDLESLVDDMLIFAGGVNDTQQEMDLVSLVTSVIETVRPQLTGGVNLRLVSADGPHVLSGNAAAIHCALLNLVMNAVQVSPADSEVVITVGAGSDHVSLSVRDQGPGVPEEFHDRLLEPFFSTRSQGTGLGLAVVNTVAQAHGGEVEIRDVLDGAEFTIRLPRRFAAGAAIIGSMTSGQEPVPYV